MSVRRSQDILREASLQEKRAAQHEPAQTNGAKGIEVDIVDDDNPTEERQKAAGIAGPDGEHEAAQDQTGPGTAPNAEQIEEEQEEISGYINLALLDRTLASNMPKLCSVYFPQGKQIGDQWVWDSLRIELRRAKAGHWVNLGAPPEEKKANRAGKFVQLLMLLRNWTFGQAVTSISRILKIRLIQPWQDYVLSQDVFYEPASAHYWIPHPKGGWIRVNESGAKRFLQDKGIATKKPDGALMSPMDRALLSLNQNMDVVYANPLCGFNAQVIAIQGGQRALVTTSPQLIKPVQGQFPAIAKLLWGLFYEKPEKFDPASDLEKLLQATPEDLKTLEQARYFLSWLSVALKTQRSGERRPGQAVALLGPRDCGKSFLIDHIIVPSLGGRVAEPYQFMSGQTPFNGQLFVAEVLKVDDQSALKDIASRRAFGMAIKRFSANDQSECHAKFRQGIVLPIFWRLVIAANDDDEDLMVLPPIDEGLQDKLMLFRCEKRPMPMPTNTIEQRKAFAQVIHKELPAFCDYLKNWSIPEELIAGRFGVKEYHHPKIIETLNRLNPEHVLLELLVSCLFPNPTTDPWKGTLTELEHELTSNTSPLIQSKVKRLFAFQHAPQTYLRRLKRRYFPLVDWEHTAHGGIWTIMPEIASKI
jgi:hypothetical protein